MKENGHYRDAKTFFTDRYTVRSEIVGKAMIRLGLDKRYHI